MGENGGSCVLRILMQLNKLYRNPGSIGRILGLEKKRQVQLLWKEGLVKCGIKLWLTNNEEGDKEGDALCIREGRNDNLRLEGKLET